MRKLLRISGIALCVCLAVLPLGVLFPENPTLHGMTTTGTRDGDMVEVQVLYQRGFVSGVADYSFFTGKDKYPSSEVFLAAIESGEATHARIEWSVNWIELVESYVVIWLFVGLIYWWWNQEEPHQLERPKNSDQAEDDQAADALGTKP